MVLVSAIDTDYNGADGASYTYAKDRVTQLIKKQLFDAQVDNPFRAFGYLRSIIKAFKASLSDARVTLPDGTVETVEMIYARPDRAIAKMKASRNLKLPLMSIEILNIQTDEARYRPNFNVEYWTVKNKETRRATRVAALSPKAVNIEANIHLWARSGYDMFQLIEYINLKFHPHLRLAIQTNRYTHAFIESSSDNSVLTVDDREDKVIRKTITLNIEGYIPTRKYVIQANGDIEEFNMEYYIHNDSDFNYDTVEGKNLPSPIGAGESGDSGGGPGSD